VSYIPPQDRTSYLADAATRQSSNPDFQLLCEGLISDLVDRQEAMIALDGTALTRAQGAATELRRVLDIIYGAPMVATKVAAGIAQTIQRQRAGYIQMAGRMSDQA
jgi:hypothetical protein